MRCNTCDKEITSEVFYTLGFEDWIPFCSEDCQREFTKEDEEDEEESLS